MAYINPFIRVNAGGIPRLEAISVDKVTNITYKFKEHKFLNYPYAGLLIIKLPAVSSPPSGGNVYFTSGDNNSNVLVKNYAGTNLTTDNTTLVTGGIFVGWYEDGELKLLTNV